MPVTIPSATAAVQQPVAKCLYCGSSKSIIWLKRVRDRLQHVAGEWEFYRCNDCGSAILHPMPKPEELASLYPEVYTFAPEIATRSWLAKVLTFLEYQLFFRPNYGVQAKIVRDHVRKTSLGKRLLDIGCGRGLRLLEFRRLGFEVQGCDFVEDSVKYLNDVHQIPAQVSDLSSLDEVFEPNSFDVITAFYVIEHVLDVQEVFRACLRILKPGGTLVVVCPFSESVQATVFGRRWVCVTEAPRHTNIPSQKGFMQACREAGFENVEIKADSSFANAGFVGLSVFPGGTTTSVYGAGRWLATLSRILGAVVTYSALPWVLLDKWVFRRPGSGMMFGRKPNL